MESDVGRTVRKESWRGLGEGGCLLIPSSDFLVFEGRLGWRGGETCPQEVVALLTGGVSLPSAPPSLSAHQLLTDHLPSTFTSQNYVDG